MVQPLHQKACVCARRAECPAAQAMAKSTNHTAHNQSYKNHRNGIKKPFALKKGQKRPMKGVSERPIVARDGARCAADACFSSVGCVCCPCHHCCASITP